MINLRKIIESIIVGLFLATIILIIKNQYSWLLLKNAEYGMPMLIEKGSIDNLFIGSSTFRQGLDIEEIQKSLGENSYILSYDGNQPVMEYMELRYLYENGVSIDTLYIDLYPYSAASQFKISDVKIFLETDMMFKKDVANLLVQQGDWKGVLEMWLSANNELLLTWPIVYPMVNQRFFHGGSTVETISSSKEVLDDMPVPQAGKLVSIQMKAMTELARLANTNGTRVIFVEIPKYISVEKSEAYEELLSEMYETLWNYEIIKSEDVGRFGDKVKDDEGEYFTDLIHLSSLGREKYTEELMKYLLNS